MSAQRSRSTSACAGTGAIRGGSGRVGIPPILRGLPGAPRGLPGRSLRRIGPRRPARPGRGHRGRRVPWRRVPSAVGTTPRAAWSAAGHLPLPVPLRTPQGRPRIAQVRWRRDPSRQNTGHIAPRPDSRRPGIRLPSTGPATTIRESDRGGRVPCSTSAPSPPGPEAPRSFETSTTRPPSTPSTIGRTRAGSARPPPAHELSTATTIAFVESAVRISRERSSAAGTDA